MNYQKVYQSLVNKGLSRKSLNCYYEKHHIIPRALGGSNDFSNIVKLTGREHFIAHVLLAKIHGGSMWGAVTIMKNHAKTSRIYEMARHKHSENLKGVKRPSYVIETLRKANLGRNLSEEHKLKISENNKNRKHSEETKLKIGKANKGKKMSDEQKDKLRMSKLGKVGPNKGKKFSEEHRNALKIASQRRWHPELSPLIP